MVLNDLRAAARPVGEDDDLVVRQVWNGVERSLGDRPGPPEDHTNEDQDDQEPLTDGRFNDAIDHRVPPS
ncbi:hypothetical protein D3C78_1877120 [compost metagenome]